jgi:hypothetical protein
LQLTKKNLFSAGLLAHYDSQQPIVITCDASSYGVGAVISHMVDGRERPVAFASRTMSKTERNYGQIDREALPVIYAVKHFHQYVYGREFRIITDHRPLLGLLAA